MKLRDLAFAGIRLLALYVGYQGLSQLVNVYYIGIPAWLNADFRLDTSRLIVLYSISPIVILGVGALLWFCAAKLSGFLIPRQETAEPFGREFRMAYHMIIAIAGLVLLILSTANLVKAIPSLATYLQYTNNPMNREYLYHVIAEALKAAAGIVLLVKADGVRKWIETSRVGENEGQEEGFR